MLGSGTATFPPGLFYLVSPLSSLPSGTVLYLSQPPVVTDCQISNRSGKLARAPQPLFTLPPSPPSGSGPPPPSFLCTVFVPSGCRDTAPEARRLINNGHLLRSVWELDVYNRGQARPFRAPTSGHVLTRWGRGAPGVCFTRTLRPFPLVPPWGPHPHDLLSLKPTSCIAVGAGSAVTNLGRAGMVGHSLSPRGSRNRLDTKDPAVL